MDNRRKDPHNLMSLRSFPLVSQAMQDGSLQLATTEIADALPKCIPITFL